jgi:NitT/TauT family transport system substrate-binding protein
MILAIPDLISNSYFPAVAAAELGFFADEGLDVDVELIFPVDKCYAALRDGSIDFVGGSAHSALSAFPGWRGVKLIAAQGQGMYWFLVMRRDLDAARGDLDVVKGRRIGAAPWVDMGLKYLLAQAGYDLERDQIDIAPVPGATGSTTNFGLTAARALENGDIDGFWANGMGAEVAVRSGAGTVALDVRRGDGPQGCFDYTLASVAASDELIARSPETVAAAVRAIGRTHRALRADVSLATRVGEARFPETEAKLISTVVERDLPYYDVAISPQTVAGMNAFARGVGILADDIGYEHVVATRFADLWRR